MQQNMPIKFIEGIAGSFFKILQYFSQSKYQYFA